MQLYQSVSQEILFKLDKNYNFIEISDNVTHILSYSKTELLNQNIQQYLVDSFSHDMIPSCNTSQLQTYVLKFKKKNSSVMHLKTTWKSNFSEANSFLGLTGSFIDYSNEIKSNEISHSMKRILENKTDILYKYRIYPTPGIIYIGKALEHVLGYTIEESLKNPKKLFKTCHPDDQTLLKERFEGVLGFDTPIQIRWVHKDGHIVWIEDSSFPEYDSEGKLIAIEGVCRDITEQKKLADRLYFLTYHDQLTECKNRHYYEEQAQLYNNKLNKSIGLLVADIDNLKVTNDLYGHNEGDLLIQKTAQFLVRASKDFGEVCRIGGDEFVIIVTDATFEIMNKISNAIKYLLLHCQEHEPIVDLSFGCSFSDISIGYIGSIFSQADQKMYQQKKNKKKKYSI